MSSPSACMCVWVIVYVSVVFRVYPFKHIAFLLFQWRFRFHTVFMILWFFFPFSHSLCVIRSQSLNCVEQHELHKNDFNEQRQKIRHFYWRACWLTSNSIANTIKRKFDNKRTKRNKWVDSRRTHVFLNKPPQPKKERYCSLFLAERTSRYKITWSTDSLSVFYPFTNKMWPMLKFSQEKATSRVLFSLCWFHYLLPCNPNFQHE